MCTPVIRIQVDRHQYMFRRGTAESAWRQGNISPWLPGTTSVSGSVRFDRERPGWLSVGYKGLIEEGKSISDGATVKSEPDDSGSAWAQTTTYAPRFCRLQLNGSRPATMQCMALPPGVYLFYAQWRPTDPRVQAGKIVAEFTRWRLQDEFAAKWVVLGDRPLTDVNFDLSAMQLGEIEVHVPASDSLQTVFLLPWGQPSSDPPPVDSDQAWRMARWVGHQMAIEKKSGTFKTVPEGRYRLFLVEHDEPAKDDETLVEYRVVADETVVLREGANAAVSF
jgi:hypothetical protein